ncbi:MFS transporter, partial [candidate division WOR-3 bacterium]|nr:MFS transporter [candidate division WOR-3 bacterium]
QAGGGVLAILGGFYVKFILSTFGYPKNFSILFITAGFIVAIALLSWIIADEPSSENQIKIKKFRSFLKVGFSLLSKDTDFKAIFFYKIVIGIAMGPVPFYSLFAIKMLNIDASNIGFFIVLQMAGLIVSNILWERISKNGVKYIMIITALSILLQPIVAVCSLFYGILPMYIVFFLIGVSVSGLRISSMTYLLHIAPDNKRPTYMGFYNTFTAPFLFYPMLNGIIINLFSFIPTFIISGIFAIIAFILVVKYISN